MPALKVLTNQR